jgi:L-lysine exporter family protein LysE/ArgO
VILPLVSGLSAGLSLIVAIGAQNAFVLRQGIQRSHVAMVVAVCAVSDLVLILLGVAGIGVLLDRAPAALVVIRWAGAAFLLVYGALAARRAVRGERMTLPGDKPPGSRTAVLATCLAFTWLNPHVYLDTVLLLGSLAAAQGEAGRWWFAAGAGLGSIAWFTALGAGARFLAPLFRRQAAWRVLDAVIAVVMVTLAVLLLA